MAGYRTIVKVLLCALLGGVLVGNLLSGYRPERKDVPKEIEGSQPFTTEVPTAAETRTEAPTTAKTSPVITTEASTVETTSVSSTISTPNGCFFTHLTETETLLTCTGNVTENLPVELDTTIWITVSNTNVTTISKEIFAQYPNLTLIDFTDNYLQDISEDAFSGLPNLTSLYLWRNNLSDASFDDDTSYGLSSLTTLYLNRNQLTMLPMRLLDGTTSLRYLNIANNNIGNFEPEFCLFLRNLQFLDLSYNRISSLAFAEDCMPNLGILNVDGNEISVIQGGALVSLRNLKTFTASEIKTNLTIEDEAFNGNLTKLDLSRNPNINISTTNVASLESLEEISLDGCHLAYFNGTPFMATTNLTRLAIHDNPFVCDCRVSWMVEAMNERKPWALDWGPGNSTYFRPRCGSPDWMREMDITELYPDDLTCEPPDITAISDTNQNNTWNTTDIVFEAVLTKGIPYSTWMFPDGRNMTSRNRSDKADVTNGYSYNAWLHPEEMMMRGNMDSNWGGTATEIIWANHSVAAKLMINRDFDMIGPVNFTLKATNVAGDSNLTFRVYTPLPEMCRPYCNYSFT